MYYIIASLMLVAIVAICVSACSLGVRIIIARIKGDEFEYNRLTISYEEAEHHAIMSYGCKGVTREIFAKYWEREKRLNPRALPYDAFCSLMEEVAMIHEPDPEIWS